MNHYLRAIGGFSRDVWLALASNFFIFFAFLGVNGVVLNLYYLGIGVTADRIGYLYGVHNFVGAAMGVPAGILARKWGTKKPMLLGILIYSVGYAFPPAAESLPPELRIPWLVLGHVLTGAGVSLYLTNIVPYLVKACTGDQRPYAFSIMSVSLPLSGFLGSLLGGALPGWYGTMLSLAADSSLAYRCTTVVATVSSALAVPCVAMARDLGVEVSVSDRSGHSGQRRARVEIPVWYLLVVALFAFSRAAGEISARSFFNVYLNRRLEIAAGGIGTIVGAAQMAAGLAALAAPAVMKAAGKVGAVSAGAVGAMIGLLVISLFPVWHAAALGFVLTIAMISLATPAFTVLYQESTAREWRPLISGVRLLAVGLARAAVSVMGGVLVANQRFATLFQVGGICMGVGALIIVLGMRFGESRARAAAR